MKYFQDNTDDEAFHEKLLNWVPMNSFTTQTHNNTRRLLEKSIYMKLYYRLDAYIYEPLTTI